MVFRPCKVDVLPVIADEQQKSLRIVHRQREAASDHKQIRGVLELDFSSCDRFACPFTRIKCAWTHCWTRPGLEAASHYSCHAYCGAVTSLRGLCSREMGEFSKCSYCLVIPRVMWCCDSVSKSYKSCIKVGQDDHTGRADLLTASI